MVERRVLFTGATFSCNSAVKRIVWKISFTYVWHFWVSLSRCNCNFSVNIFKVVVFKKYVSNIFCIVRHMFLISCRMNKNGNLHTLFFKPYAYVVPVSLVENLKRYQFKRCSIEFYVTYYFSTCQLLVFDHFSH